MDKTPNSTINSKSSQVKVKSGNSQNAGETPAPNYEIILLSGSDAEAIQDLLAEAFRQDPSLVALFKTVEKPNDNYYRLYMKVWVNYSLQQKDHLFGIRINGTLAGVVGISGLETKPSLYHLVRKELLNLLKMLPGLRPVQVLSSVSATMRPKQVDKQTCEIFMLAVHPNYQGHGIGRKLLDKAHALIADRADKKEVYLFTTLKESFLFYEHLGYQLVEKRKASLVDVFHLQRQC